MKIQQKTLGEVTAPRIDQAGPDVAEFTYIDIGSIDRETKRILEPKVLPKAKAPSRAKQRLKTGDVLVSMTRPNLNAVALVPPTFDGAIGSTGFHVLRPHGAVPAYLFYAVQSPAFVDAMCRKVQGALYPAVRPRDIAGYSVPLPDEPEQHRIVAEIEKQFTRLDAGVAALRRVQANLKRYRAAVLKAACEGRLVPTEATLARQEGRTFESGEQLLQRILADRRKNWTGRGKFKEPVAPDTNNLPPMPEGWTCASFDHVIDRMRNGTTADQNKNGVGTPVSRIETIWNSRIDWERVRHIAKPTTELLDEYKLQLGDLLFSHINSDTHLGKTAIYTDSTDVLLHGMNLMLLRPNKAAIVPAYLHYLCMHYRAAGTFIGIAQHAVNQSSINQAKLKLVSAPLPPLAEQKRIVAEVERRLSVIDELETVFTANFARATRLRQSILQSTFCSNR